MAADDEPVVSVIVPMRNEAAHIGEQLAALADQDPGEPWELVVVDNGSTDGSAGIVEAMRPRLPSLRLVSAPDARNGAEARNIGVSAARGSLLLHTDADDVVGPRWARALVDVLRDHDLASGPIEVTRLNPPGSFGWREAVHEPWPVSGGFLPYASTANLGIRREAFDAIGGFDGRLRRAADVDLSWRAQLAGFTTGSAPDALVHRRLRSSPVALFRQHHGYARSGATLAAKFRRHRLPRAPWRFALHEWGFLVVRAPRLGDADFRRSWMVVAGRRVGHLQGLLEVAARRRPAR